MHLDEDRIWSTIATSQWSTIATKQPNPNTIAAKPSNPASLKKSGKIAIGADTFPCRPVYWLTEFAHLVTDRLDNGWSGYMVTVMFSDVHGTRPTVLQVMKDEIARLYSILVTDVHRKPRTAPTDELPVLLGALDLPVVKRRRITGTQPSYNDGLHFHGLVLLPPTSRLKQDLAEYFCEKRGLYVRAGKPVERIHVQSVDRDPARATDYVLKTVRRGRLAYDDAFLIFPRARSELGH